MKKILSIILSLSLSMILVSCGNDDSSSKTSESVDSSSSVTSDSSVDTEKVPGEYTVSVSDDKKLCFKVNPDEWTEKSSGSTENVLVRSSSKLNLNTFTTSNMNVDRLGSFSQKYEAQYEQFGRNVSRNEIIKINDFDVLVIEALYSNPSEGPDTKYVEYYILTEGSTVAFGFSLDANTYEENKAVIDGIINSISIK